LRLNPDKPEPKRVFEKFRKKYLAVIYLKNVFTTKFTKEPHNDNCKNRLKLFPMNSLNSFVFVFFMVHEISKLIASSVALRCKVLPNNVKTLQRRD